MQDHWAEHGPPVHIAVAAFLGMAKPKKRKGKLQELIGLLGAKGGAF